MAAILFTKPRKLWKSILYLHLDYNNTTETMEINFLYLHYNITTEIVEINFIFTFRLQQYHEDDGNQMNFTIRLQQVTKTMEFNFIFTFRF